MDITGILLCDYPLTQRALEEELFGLEPASSRAVFFGPTFPWSFRDDDAGSMVYPEQIFPRLSSAVKKKEIGLVPGIIFPDDCLHDPKSKAITRLFENMFQYPEPLWALVEDSVMDMLGLCDWTKECCLFFRKDPFGEALYSRFSKRFENENGIKLIRLHDGFRFTVPGVVQSCPEYMRISDSLDDACNSAWRLVRCIRELAFSRSSRPKDILKKLEETILQIKQEVPAVIDSACVVLDRDWLVSSWKMKIDALSEEYALLCSRFSGDYL